MISHLGRYEIISELGRGSMGIVYKAKDPLIERLVAVKSINLQGLETRRREEYEARFYQEAKAAGHLNHPNIVTIHDLGESSDMAYIAMELMEGRELHSDFGEMPRLPVDKALNIAIQVADGLSYAHQHGIVHRDIKPSNIMVLGDGHVKIADFGIAKMDSALSLTKTGMIMGSPLYMSPEQVKGDSITAQSDIFSLGIVLYQILTGRRPFFGDNANTLMYQIVNQAPPKSGSLNPEIPEMLDAIVTRCLEKNPKDRYPNAKELAKDLRSCREKLLGIAGHENSFMINSHFKSLKRLMIPGGISPTFVAIGSYFLIVLVYALDEMTDATIQLHMLYMFPLIMTSFHCDRVRIVYAAVILSLVLQGLTLMTHSDIPLFSKLVTAAFVLPTNILIAYVSRIARANFLEVGHLASFDGLTGLHNRLSFESMMEEEIVKQKRNGGVFSFAFIDIDNLKELNDSRGTQAGDDALKLLANVMREHLRQSDTVARLGGDEFAILMPDTGAADCESLCEQLLVRISNRMAEAAFPVSASIGCATFGQAPASISEVFIKAESAMHVAQKSGKGYAVSG